MRTLQLHSHCTLLHPACKEQRASQRFRCFDRFHLVAVFLAQGPKTVFVLRSVLRLIFEILLKFCTNFCENTVFDLRLKRLNDGVVGSVCGDHCVGETGLCEYVFAGRANPNAVCIGLHRCQHGSAHSRAPQTYLARAKSFTANRFPFDRVSTFHTQVRHCGKVAVRTRVNWAALGPRVQMALFPEKAIVW